MNTLKYSKELYEDCDFYGGDMDCDIDITMKKIVRCRKPHDCMGGCEGTIPAGDYALCERGFMDNKPVSCYTCIDCLDKWIEESGLVELEDR